VTTIMVHSAAESDATNIHQLRI